MKPRSFRPSLTPAFSVADLELCASHESPAPVALSAPAGVFSCQFSQLTRSNCGILAHLLFCGVVCALFPEMEQAFRRSGAVLLTTQSVIIVYTKNKNM